MNPIRATSTTDEILREAGGRLQRYRLQQNRTVDEIALSAGIHRNTVANAESGNNPSLATIVKILRALGRIESLDAFLPAPLASPIQLASTQGRPRQRARPSRRKPTGG